MRKLRPDPKISLGKLDVQLTTSFDTIKNRFPDMIKNDVRLTFYGQTINTTESTLFCRIFENDLLNKNWYKRNFSDVIINTPDEIHKSVEAFDSFIVVAFTTLYFASVENFFRVLSNVVYPNEFKGNDYFSTIYKSLLKKFNLNYIHIFDIFRLIRNSLHNNGVYNDKENQRFYYNDEFYELKKGVRIKVSWFLLSNLSRDIEECVFKIINTKKISNFDIIEDPSYYEF